MAKTEPETARELARLSSDCSFLVSHLIRQNDGKDDGKAREVLMAILNVQGTPPKPVVRGSKVGWYGTAQPYIFNPATLKRDGASAVEAVCFTESTPAGLRAHRDVFSVKYGLAFDRDWLFGKGGNPCLNIGDKLLRRGVHFTGDNNTRYVYNFIPKELHAFVNVINGGFDATHEREWRGRSQSIDATKRLNPSAGVIQPNVCRGRLLSWRATAFNSARV